MLRAGYLLVALSIITAALSYILLGGNYAFLVMVCFPLLFLIGYRFLKGHPPSELIPMLTIHIFFNLYNILYIILLKISVIDLYAVNWRISVQLVLPCLIGFCIRALVIGYSRN
ncbi:hypothetical protein [Paenibacillus monticola]|uniref:CPBP family intramembrane metalloprotease n=1 Tax=Paenibacillus monticola TaxID=2666075 RepID=A0A7X2H6C3_9BACL|nr:hypothetical protein [Paenibacillus monticola]MRN54332.1 hypothetical protein [Paenibacillus monticola]